jgi:hypothetical protein
MRSAMLDAAQFGKTSGMAAKLIRCAQINRMLGTQLTPWELDELPDEWLTALELWSAEYPRAKAWAAEAQASLQKLRDGRKQVH